QNRFDKHRQFGEYTPLWVPISEVFLEIKRKGLVQWPKRMTSNPGYRDNRRYYEFYKDIGHTTNECPDLKNAIEELIKKVHMKEFL
ncbi:hypothetical protein KJJ93_29910, partial [Escherichia coli]|uniref:hypothetical protein n=1 Tax=Escherichia coli TaxID=562 RepID=UPI001BD93242